MAQTKKNLTLEQALAPLHKQHGFSISSVNLIVDQNGYFVGGDLATEFPMHTGGNDKNYTQFNSVVVAAYQVNFQRWFTKVVQELTQTAGPRQVCFPIKSTLKDQEELFLHEQQVWVYSELSRLPAWLNRAFTGGLKLGSNEEEQKLSDQPSKALYMLKLVRLDERLQRSLYQAQSTIRFGLKHDLANRLFLFKALPEMIEFAEPQELLDDLLMELPNLLNFLADRLAAKYTESVQLPWVKYDQDIFTAFEKLSELTILNRLINFESPQDSEVIREFSSDLQYSFLAVEWSLIYLGSISKHLMSSKSRNPDKLIQCSLEYYSDLDNSTRSTQFKQDIIQGDCGFLANNQMRYCLKLCFKTETELSLEQVLSDWYCLGLDLNYSQGINRSSEKDQAWAIWMDSWRTAAHLLKGVVKILDHQTIAIIF